MSDEKKDGGPAFAHGNPVHGGDPGMTLRDYFAAAALSGILSCYRDYSGHNTHQDRVSLSYQYADLMLAQRSKP